MVSLWSKSYAYAYVCHSCVTKVMMTWESLNRIIHSVPVSTSFEDLILLCILITLPHWSVVAQNLCWGQSSYVLHRCMSTWHVYAVCMSSALNGCSALEHFKHNRNMQWNKVWFLPGTATVRAMEAANPQDMQIFMCEQHEHFQDTPILSRALDLH